MLGWWGGCGVAGRWEGAVVGLGHKISVGSNAALNRGGGEGSNGPGGYGGAGWMRHAGAGEWGELVALWEVGGWGQGGDGGRGVWEVGRIAVHGAWQPGPAGKVATSSRLGKRLGLTGVKWGRTK